MTVHSARLRRTPVRRTLSLTASASALGAALLMLGAAPAMAQDQTGGAATVPDTTQTPATAANPNITPGSVDQSVAQQAAAEQAVEQTDSEAAASGDIVVTGFRAALRSATAKKKAAETVVESVSAEDIGKLPDNGIGESIARLPGVSAQRSNGRANIISIRGFGPDFSSTTLNGRQQTTTNDSRAVEFDQYPSEILAGVDVYKTAEADHTAGGLVGSIDLRTIRPLEVSKRVLAVGARGTYVDQKLNPNISDTGYRVYGTYVDKFMDDRVGVAISAAYADEPYHTKNFNAWGFEGYPGGAQGMSGFKTYVESDKLKRFGGNATVQVEADDNTRFTVDAFYSHFVDRIDQRGFEMPLSGTRTNVQSNSDGLVTMATITGKPVIENYANDRTADQYAIGWNGVWDNHDGWRVMGDLSWSRTDRDDSSIQTTAGLGYNLPNPTATITYNVTDKGPQFTSNYNGASSALVLTDVQGWSSSPIQAGYENLRRTSDDLVEARGEIEREIGGFLKSIKVGADYVTRTKQLRAAEAFLSPPNGATAATLPASLRIDDVQLDRGLGPIIAYDPRILVDEGVLTRITNTYGDTKGYAIDEEVWTPYAMGSLNGQLGSATLTGNFGVQGVHTRVNSRSSGFTPVEDKYWMVLPSVNLNLRTASDFVIRAAASKEMMRARLPDLNNIITLGVDTSRNPIVYSGSGGNPYLRPYQAWAFDLNFEKYFGNRGYLAIQLFYKDIDTYIANGFTDQFDYSSFPKPAGIQPATPIGYLYANVNTHGGNMYGGEVAGTLPFEVISSALTGFGITGGAGYTETKVKDFNGADTVIPGYSKWVANATVFYENHGLNLRGSMRYRSSFLGDFGLYSGGLERQTVLPETIFDAQIGYDFGDTSMFRGLSLYVQGQNLTDERSATLATINGSTIDNGYLRYQSYGRRFVGGFTYKF